MTPVASVSDLLMHLRGRVRDGAALRLDSRQVRPGDVFIACPGLRSDGRDFIAQAVTNGASAIVCQAPLTGQQTAALGQIPVFEVQDIRAWLGPLADAWWGHPSRSMTIVAVTGTNGKTTTAQWIAAALRAAGHPCGVIGTLGMTGVDGHQSGGALTTPDVVSLHHQLDELARAGASHVVMEASSIGLDQGRLDSVEIDVAVFTNLTQDHLDYHGDMTAYAAAKSLLFQRPELRYAVINADDPSAQSMVAATSARVLRYGVARSADIRAAVVEPTARGVRFDLIAAGQTVSVHAACVGAHNVSNLLAVTGVLQVLGTTLPDTGRLLASLPAVPGRLEPVAAVAPVGHGDAGPQVFVDYAHTPDALHRVLQALRPLAQARAGQLWCLIGCGGNRDAGKRPLMAAAAQAQADRVMLTSDNPRDEDPQAILRQMQAGLNDRNQVQVEVDRALAILSVVWQAGPADVVLLAGKGHETWQEIQGLRHPFDDRQWASLGLTLGAHQCPVQTDTRQLSPGALFVALRGARFDGHDYLAQASQAGAIAAVVQTRVSGQALPQFVLGDTLSALQKIACAWRRRFDLPVIGVAGSNGKTTTKEMIASMLQAWLGPQATLSTQGNLNNEIGVPLTVLRLRPQHRAAVIEMGMNHPGEMALLTTIAQPSIGLVLNAQREHQEFMRSVQAVAQENGAVLSGLGPLGTAVYPAEDRYTPLWRALASHVQSRRTFGVQIEADVSVHDVQPDALGSRFTLVSQAQSHPVELPLSGRHNVANAAAAAACALAAGAPMAVIVRALRDFKAVKGRMQTHRLPDGRVLVDDSYNANPDSVRAAIDVLASLPSPRALVLGDMGEVGDQGPQMHAEVGQYARERSIDHLWTLGRATLESVRAFGSKARAFDGPEALCEFAQSVKPMSVLVKGSRFMAMERVVHTLLRTHSTNGQEVPHAG